MCAAHLTAAIHRWAETGGTECERRVLRIAASPFPPVTVCVLVRCLRCLGEVVVQRRRAQASDCRGTQAGGVSPPFTVCAHSWFEVWGSVWESEGGGGLGGERGLSDRCGVLDVALRAWALSCRGLGAGAVCELLL